MTGSLKGFHCRVNLFLLSVCFYRKGVGLNGNGKMVGDKFIPGLDINNDDRFTAFNPPFESISVQIIKGLENGSHV